MSDFKFNCPHCNQSSKLPRTCWARLSNAQPAMAHFSYLSHWFLLRHAHQPRPRNPIQKLILTLRRKSNSHTFAPWVARPQRGSPRRKRLTLLTS
jgi:hypothetical protein